MRDLRYQICGVVVLCALAGVNFVVAQTKSSDGKQPPGVVQVKQDTTSQAEPRGSTAGAENEPVVPTAATSAPSTTSPAPANAAPTASAAENGPGASTFNSGNIAAAPTSDLAAIFSNTGNASGVEIQRRNTIIADPRIRGYHIGQIATWGDGGFFFPARQDLDTAISKFEPGSIREMNVIKGPYATRYGPGFAFLDIVTFDTPRAKEGCDWELHGRTELGYQTNGQRWNGLQSVEYGGRDWGFRASYNIMVGNDYKDGDGNLIPSSYNSQNVNFGIGLDLSPNSSIELKGFRLHQKDLEFPSLYFDIRELDTEAYNLRYSAKNQPYFDLFTADLWYNYTVASGDTLQSYKQAFLSRFLPQFGFALPSTPNQPAYPNFQVPGSNPPAYLPLLTDSSTTRFSERTLGYRLAGTWGRKDSLNFVLGTDFTYLGQGQTETIVINDPSGQVSTDPTTNTATQNLGLPNSNSYNPGVFAEANLPVNDRLNIRSGARADYDRTTTGTRSITGTIDIFGNIQNSTGVTTVDPRAFSVEPNGTNDSRDFGLWSAFVSSDYKFDDALTGILGFGVAQRAPTLTELYAVGPLVGVLQPGINRLIGDPELNPEKLKQFDAGLRADYGWFKGSVNGFYAWIDDYITYDLNKSSAGSITQVVFTNTDRATLAGGEMYGQVEATSWLTPFSSLSYVEGRDLTHRDNRRAPNIASSRRGDTVAAAETEPLPGIPPLEIRVGSRVHQSVANNVAPKWSVELSARCAFPQDQVAISLGELPTPGFTVWDLRSYWQATDHLTLTAGVENFGDKNYREALDLRAFPGYFRPGTNFYFTTQFKY